MQTIAFANARKPIVLAIDVGSSSVRALLYDGHGNQVVASETQLAYAQHITTDVARNPTRWSCFAC